MITELAIQLWAPPTGCASSCTTDDRCDSRRAFRNGCAKSPRLPAARPSIRISSPGRHRRALFATSDSPAIYASLTRPRGWTDLNESALHPSSYGAWPDAMRLNLIAWRALAGCTRAIVAPIASAFSKSAAQKAGVPLVQCCAQAFMHHPVRPCFVACPSIHPVAGRGPCRRMRHDGYQAPSCSLAAVPPQTMIPYPCMWMSVTLTLCPLLKSRFYLQFIPFSPSN